MYLHAFSRQFPITSCWSFAATEQIESDCIRTQGFSTTDTLTTQQSLTCDTKSWGCNGGWPESAYNYISSAGGLETEDDYPYTGKDTGKCKADKSAFVATIKKYTTIEGESTMTSYVQKKGPIAVCLDATNWNTYKRGVLRVCGQQITHCVQAVGVDTSSSSGGYWKLRNSWGKQWGQDGYILISYGANTCHITYNPTYTKVEKM